LRAGERHRPRRLQPRPMGRVHPRGLDLPLAGGFGRGPATGPVAHLAGAGGVRSTLLDARALAHRGRGGSAGAVTRGGSDHSGALERAGVHLLSRMAAVAASVPRSWPAIRLALWAGLLAGVADLAYAGVRKFL